MGVNEGVRGSQSREIPRRFPNLREGFERRQRMNPLATVIKSRRDFLYVAVAHGRFHSTAGLLVSGRWLASPHCSAAVVLPRTSTSAAIAPGDPQCNCGGT
ncbi:MAG: hypothetical protein H5T64_06570 [Chloroflexi bacterium]|nr:hypothetical protein [Chloroflexota bacterium]